MNIACVIPTRDRPDLVVRAVHSALAQTLPPAEVIVVVDGPDPATVSALAAMADPLLRVIVQAEPLGPAAARNRGVEAASSEWVALLDDDDFWLPPKLARQAAMAAASHQPYPILASRFVARTPRGDFVWPARLPGAEPLGDYLLDRPGLLGRPGFVATPTLMARRDMLLRVPFPALEDHEDWGWLLEATAAFGTWVEMAEEPLCIVKINEMSRSQRDTWEASFAWAERYCSHLSRRAYAGFIATKVAGKARRQGDWAALPRLLAAMLRFGSPTAAHLALFAGTWALPAWGHRLAQSASFADAYRPSSPMRG